eukprot:TRINITY_DN4942_c0_g1_i1.p1 TRINITY_DN4942_c0_g1~~TRINITY_DN4942_c0_g1_i1.p1  ORF type:complete len:328 (-),score=45.80 TRINITY_DN4942_c0_g1_i1:25-1008(-)
MTGQDPWPRLNPAQIWAAVKSGRRPEFPQHYPSFLRELYNNCVDPSPDNRYTFNKIISILEHHQASDIDEDYMFNLHGESIGALRQILEKQSLSLRPDRNSPHLHLFGVSVATVVDKDMFGNFKELIQAPTEATRHLGIGSIICVPEEVGIFWMYYIMADSTTQNEIDKIMVNYTHVFAEMGKHLVVPMQSKSFGIIHSDMNEELMEKSQAVYIILYQVKRMLSSSEVKQGREEFVAALEKGRDKGYNGMLIFEEYTDGRTHALIFWESMERMEKELLGGRIVYDGLRALSPTLSCLPTLQKCRLIEGLSNLEARYAQTFQNSVSKQ